MALMLLGAPGVSARSMLQWTQLSGGANSDGMHADDSSILTKQNMETVLRRHATPQEHAVMFSTFSFSQDITGEAPRIVDKHFEVALSPQAEDCRPSPQTCSLQLAARSARVPWAMCARSSFVRSPARCVPTLCDACMFSLALLPRFPTMPAVSSRVLDSLRNFCYHADRQGLLPHLMLITKDKL